MRESRPSVTIYHNPRCSNLPQALNLLKKKRYKEMNLAHECLSEEDVIDAMVEKPILIERPIFIRGKHAALGRPPERALEIV